MSTSFIGSDSSAGCFCLLCCSIRRRKSFASLHVASDSFEPAIEIWPHYHSISLIMHQYDYRYYDF